jgi:YHS domain-containing protein
MTDEQRTRPDTAVDPVCGMTVDIAAATSAGLTIEGVALYFCGRGCKLDFGDDPAKYREASYKPSM